MERTPQFRLSDEEELQPAEHAALSPETNLSHRPQVCPLRCCHPPPPPAPARRCPLQAVAKVCQPAYLPSINACPLQAVFNLDLDYSDDDALLDWEQYAGQQPCQAALPSPAACTSAVHRRQRLLHCATVVKLTFAPAIQCCCRHETRSLLRPGLLIPGPTPAPAAVVVSANAVAAAAELGMLQCWWAWLPGVSRNFCI
jgi:hypothetical protein